MNIKIKRLSMSVSSAMAFAVFAAPSYSQSIVPGGSSWADSYSVNGTCYCASTYDHGIGDYTVETPAGIKTVVEVCEAIGPGPGKGSNPIYNTVQCGHEPGHEEKGNFLYTDGVRRYVADEIECPGRVDDGPEGCSELGPKWDLSVFGPTPTTELTIPGSFEAEDFTSNNGVRVSATSDSGGSDFIGWIEDGDSVSYNVNVLTQGEYSFDLRVASPVNGSVINLSSDGNSANPVSVSVPNTGNWQGWTTINTILDLPAGEQTLTLSFEGGSGGLLNVNWIDASLVNAPVSYELDRTNWSLSASTNVSDVYNAIDDDAESRWTTYRQVQQNGQTFTIDFNQTQSFDRIVLDSEDSANDQPRGYSVHVSNDGSNWGSAIASGEGDSGGVTTINFADQNARFIRITQTGSATRNWWSIHEASVFANSH